MPDVLSHMVCAEESLQYISEDMKDILIANKNLFNLGAQGPDIFFYYRPQPWKDSKGFGDYGSTIHTESINHFFLNAANRIKHAIAADPVGFFKSNKKTSALHKEFAYLAGFLSHYALDTIGHPFIFYFSGIDAGYNHKYLETVIDTLITDIYDGKKLRVHKTGKAIELNKHENKIISLFLSRVLRDTYNFNIHEDEIGTCINDMTKTLKALYDPINLKRRSFNLIDKLSKAKGKIMTATFPAKYDKTVDYLNIKKTTWIHPCDDTMVYNESFLELLSKASVRTSELIKNLSYYLINTETADTLLNIIGDLKYDTGLKEDKDMIHENVILDFKKIYK